MKRYESAARAIAVCLVLAVSSCGDAPLSPTEPMVDPSVPAVPDVAGTYTGSIRGWVGDLYLGEYAMTMEVAQSGVQVTLTGTVEGGVIWIEPESGTIDADGRYMSMTPPADSRNCGRRSNVEIDLVFRDGTVDLRERWESELCDPARFEARLTRQ